MEKRLLGIFALLVLVVVLVSPAAFAQGTVTLSPIGDKAPGDYVTIAGMAPFSEVSVKVIRPDNTILYVDVVKVNSDGSYSKTFKLPGDAAEGVYTVVVGRGEVVATGTFRVASAGEEAQQPSSTKEEITVPEDGVLPDFIVPLGGAVLKQGDAELEIPQGAFSGAARITFKLVNKRDLPGADVIGQVFEIKIENVELSQDVTLRLPAPLGAGDRARVFKLDTVNQRWINLGGKQTNGYVEVSLRNFSLFTAANAPAPPTASPAPGTYTGSVQVTLSAESGATIFYGLNAAPQSTYTAPITLTSSATIRAVAVKDALTSDEKSFAYTVTASTGGGGSGGGGGGGGGGVVRPYVSSTDPADQATDVPVDKEIKVLFSKTVTAGDDFGKITLKDASGNAVEVDVRIDGSTLYIKPKATLAYGTSYTVVIPAGAVQDSYGYRLGSDYTFTFTTAAEQPKPPVGKFKDMAGHWAEETVVKLASMGVISGYEDGTFRPDKTITRAEVASILQRALKLASGDEAALLFVDKDEIPSWVRGSVAACAREGLIKGYPADGGVAFKAANPITRVELAAVLSRVVEAKKVPMRDQALVFTDAAAIPAWARTAVDTAAKAGIVGGYPDGSFKPDRPVTRAEAASMIVRLLERLPS